MQKSREEMLNELISWREITDRDMGNVELHGPVCLNEEEIFPRNAKSPICTIFE